jgi:hypothetical protein
MNIDTQTVSRLAFRLSSRFDLDLQEVEALLASFFRSNTEAPRQVAERDEEEEPVVAAPSLEKKTRNELVAIAASLGLRVPSSWTKPKIRQAINSALASNRPVAGTPEPESMRLSEKQKLVQSKRVSEKQKLVQSERVSEKLDKRALVERARGLGIRVPSSWTKARIQEAINAARAPLPQRPRSPSKGKRPEKPTKPTKPEKPEKPTKPTKPEKPEKPRGPNPLFQKTFRSVKGNVWVFGELLGSGGFGAVYQEAKNPGLVIKTAKPGLLKNQTSGVFFEKSVLGKLLGQNGDARGVPQIVDSGRLPDTILANDYFIVLPKFDYSLESLVAPLRGTNKSLAATVGIAFINNVASWVLGALSYINEKGYIHLDVKPDNIMTRNNRWYLIDYGLAFAFSGKETVIDPRVKNTGTGFFMSRDAHLGRLSRKADLESLVYMLVDLYGVKLPWDVPNFAALDYKEVSAMKQTFFDTFRQYDIPDAYKTFIENVDKLVPGTPPNYALLQRILSGDAR